MTLQRTPKTQRLDVVVVGAGRGGTQTAIAVRERGIEGTSRYLAGPSVHTLGRLYRRSIHRATNRTLILIRSNGFGAERGLQDITGPDLSIPLGRTMAHEH